MGVSFVAVSVAIGLGLPTSIQFALYAMLVSTFGFGCILACYILPTLVS